MDEPICFEQEFPEEAQSLMDLCDNKELRHRFQVIESSFPKDERIYTQDSLNTYFRALFGGNGLPYERSQPKMNRNSPCPCGSGKKYKKCCG